MPSFFSVRMMRQAMAPRFAIRTFSNIVLFALKLNSLTAELAHRSFDLILPALHQHRCFPLLACLDFPPRPKRVLHAIARVSASSAVQDLFLPYSGATSQISNRIGVGLYALHGLFNCGQLEMRQITSISARIST